MSPPTEMHDYSIEDPVAAPLTATYIARTLRSYRTFIGLIVLAVFVGYFIVGGVVYLLAPAVRVTSLNFRLEFTGAERGQYPNGSKFSSSAIIAPVVLLRTYKQNKLDRFEEFSEFASSVFVIESNEVREALAREYQARLADTRLTSTDRERIQREYELKVGSSMDRLSINYVSHRRVAVPEVVAKKVLRDILTNWADYAAKEQHVLEHRVAVLSVDVVAPEAGQTTDAIINAVILRGNVQRLIENVRQIRESPNAELMRTSDGFSLNDISIALENVIRYRIDPLIAHIAVTRTVDRDETVRFLSTQLAYDQRMLNWRRTVADTAQRTLSLYMSAQPQQTAVLPNTILTEERASKNGENETVMPQIGETFIDRLIQLTSRTADTEFRQKLAADYRIASLAVGTTEMSVAFDQSLLETLRNNTGPVTTPHEEALDRESAAIRTNVRQLATKVQELHKTVSQNLNPSAELLTMSAPHTRLDRAISFKVITIVGLLITLASLVAAVLLAFFHSSIRKDEKVATDVRTPAEGAP